MNGPLRSKQGCWTCRLRRKKCDERRPTCLTCESLAITCHGYGPKPEWMDGGEQEKAMANSVKQIVKHTSRRKGRLGIFRSRSKEEDTVEEAEPQTQPLAPNSTGASTESGTDSHHTVFTDGRSPAQSSATSAETGVASSNNGMLAITCDESILLMHYLDSVFPLQYPMYKPSLAEGGRGWLLALLLNTKPLYHAALGLSAYHRGAMVLEESRNACRSTSVHTQEKHLAICLSEFRDAIKNMGAFVASNCTKNGLGIMASTVQLIFFELFAGNGDAWQIHLRAATDLISKGFRELPELLWKFGFKEPTPEDYDVRLPAQDMVMFRFLSGVVVWLDIVSAVTKGNAPRLLDIHENPTFLESRTNLQDIMGCQNWAIFLMGQVTALHESKMNAMYNLGINFAELTTRAEAINKGLLRGIINHNLETTSETDKDVTCSQKHVTMVFALAGIIYLHLVVNGFDLENENISNRISEVMMILHTELGRSLRHTLVCPLYIIGCVARNESEKDFFRKIFSTPPVLDPSLPHRAKIAPLLEETWRRRDYGGTWTWQDNLRLSNHPLLLL